MKQTEIFLNVENVGLEQN